MNSIFDWHTVVAVLLTFAFAVAGLGRSLPMRTGAFVPFGADVLLFIGYLYLLRSLARLPLAIRITRRQMRKAQVDYGLSRREALRDGLLRGVFDRRRWEVGQLALLDRFMVIAGTLAATTPALGVFLVRVIGLFGVIALLLIYLFGGSFALLVGEAPVRRPARNDALPFIDLRDE